MNTTASVILKTLADAGVTHAFVNWGNDHPAFLEQLARERRAHGKTSLAIVTCPHEIVALSAAQGFAQVAGRPAAVIVHVDVGTQVSPAPPPASHGNTLRAATRTPGSTAGAVHAARDLS